jgi:hypothetical protein
LIKENLNTTAIAANNFQQSKQISISKFLSAFYPDTQEKIYLRSFKPKGALDKPDNIPQKYTVTRAELTFSEPTKHRLETDNITRGIYFVVNAGGNTDKDITRYNAFFVENDNRSIEEQHAALDAALLAPSIRNNTKKSVHAYWLIQGNCTEVEWREVQEGLIAYFDGDKNIKNPSRTMRLPFFNHVTYNGEDDYSYKPVEVVEFEPLRRYTVDEMKAAFPAPEKVQPLILSDSQFSSNSSISQEWKELNGELKKRIMQVGKKNNRGIIETRGICHNGKSKTAIMLNPATGAVKCMNGCGHEQVLRAFGLPEKPLYSSTSSNSQVSIKEDGATGHIAFPMLDREKALYGLAGDIVKAIELHSEADPVALLIQLLVGFGNAIGRTAYFTAEADRHYTNLFTVIVGASARGRKGTSWGYIKRLLEAVKPEWASNITGGLTSGEGLIHHVRDVEEDFMPGAVRPSKCALVIESEFAAVLRVQKREGNTLSSIIRQAWDSGTISAMRRNNPEKATNAHVSIIGHITDDELRKCLQETDAVNGYANRFLWACAKRSKKLPEGGNFNQDNLAPFVKRLRDAVKKASSTSEMKRDEEARELWIDIYNRLDEEMDGSIGSILSRAEAQIMRLACVYALLDCSSVIKRIHLEAANALWKYCEASALYIFGGNSISKKAQKILDWLTEASETGLNKTELIKRNGNRGAGVVNRALAELRDAGLAFPKSIPTGGRTEERWFIATASLLRTCEFDEVDELSLSDEKSLGLAA